MIVALVLAAGASERMGRPKALLKTRDGRTFLAAILDTVVASKLDDLRVVLGRDAKVIMEGARLLPKVAVANPDWESGMLSSVRAGVRALPAGPTAFLLWPVDHPMVLSSTVDAVIDEFARTLAPVVVPAHRGRGGHPVLFDVRLAPELLAAPEATGARAVVHAHAGERRMVAVNDPGVVTDIDTPERYAKVTGRRLT